MYIWCNVNWTTPKRNGENYLVQRLFSLFIYWKRDDSPSIAYTRIRSHCRIARCSRLPTQFICCCCCCCLRAPLWQLVQLRLRINRGPMTAQHSRTHIKAKWTNKHKIIKDGFNINACIEGKAHTPLAESRANGKRTQKEIEHIPETHSTEW